MHLDGIVEVGSCDEDLITKLASFGGESFLEEVWTQNLLDGVAAYDDRKLELSRGIIDKDIREAAPKSAVYCTPDVDALAIGYLKSELPIAWMEVESAAQAALADEMLTEEEKQLFEARAKEMEPISDFGWHDGWISENMPGSDYIHLVCLAVDSLARGTGAFRKLMEPFFEYADAHGIPCMLETYSDKLEQLYEHFGFETVRTCKDPAFTDYERCMVRLPK